MRWFPDGLANIGRPLQLATTKVTWAMFGPKNFVAKAVQLCMNMDKMIGDEYEESLTTLKSLVEAKTAQRSK